MTIFTHAFHYFGTIFENFPELRCEHVFLRFNIIGKARTFKKFFVKQFDEMQRMMTKMRTGGMAKMMRGMQGLMGGGGLGGLGGLGGMFKR